MQRTASTIKTDNQNAALGFAAVLVFLSPICLFIRAFFLQVFAWNLGLVGLVDAAGGNVNKISYWTAFGGLFLLGTLRSLFGRSSAVSKSLAEGIKNVAN